MPMTSNFERMLTDLQREHTRQLAELNAEINLLRKEVAQCKSEEPCAATHTETTQTSRRSSCRRSASSKYRPTTERISASFRFLPTTGSLSTKLTNQDARIILARGDNIMKSFRKSQAITPATGKRFSSYKDMIESSEFEAASAVIIIVYTLCNILAVEFNGMKRGYLLEIAGYGYRDDLWGSGVAVLNIVDLAFYVVFALEFLLRATILRCGIFSSVWNWLDLFIMVATTVDVALGGLNHSTNSKALKLFRIFRVTRILKALKVGTSFFNVLHVLMASVRASMSTLCWALIMIIPVQIVCALITIPVLDYFYDRDDVSTARKQAVFLYFGTFSRSLITFFEILFGNYATPCRVLINNVGVEYGAIITAYRCICGFSVLCVVQAVFLQQTMKTMSQDSEVMLREKAQYERTFMKNLEQLFWSLDLEGDGHLSRSEFAETLHNDDVCLHCHVLGLDPHDLVDIYQLIDEGDGVFIRDFIQAARHIRKQAKSIDMARVLANVEKTRKQLERIPSLVAQRLRSEIMLGTQDYGHTRTSANSMNDTDMPPSTCVVGMMPDGNPMKIDL